MVAPEFTVILFRFIRATSFTEGDIKNMQRFYPVELFCGNFIRGFVTPIFRQELHKSLGLRVKPTLQFAVCHIVLVDFFSLRHRSSLQVNAETSTIVRFRAKNNRAPYSFDYDWV